MDRLAAELATEVADTIRDHLLEAERRTDYGAQISRPPGRMPRKLYIGTTYGAPVTVVEGNLRTPLEHHVRHSPDGFAWSYEGSGPAELARCLLWDAIGVEPDEDLYQEFKRQVIAGLPPRKSWQLSQAAILAWTAFHETGLNNACVDCGGELLDFDPPNPALFVKATDERCGACEGQRERVRA